MSTQAGDMPIVIAYDGSDNAKHAIRVAASLLGGGSTNIVHVWEPLTTPVGNLAAYAMAGAHEEIEYEDEQAQAKAEEGAELARAMGFRATATALRGLGPVWATLCEYVSAKRPALVVMGTRGLSGVRGLLAGSVSHGVSAHSHVPVLIVPPEE